jgi:hypothetical protein
MAWPKIDDYARWSERAFELVLLSVSDNDRVRIAPAAEALYEEYMTHYFGPFSRPPKPVATPAKLYFYRITDQCVQVSMQQWRERLQSEDDGAVDLDALKSVFDEECASYRVKGEKERMIKLVGDMTLEEWRIVFQQFVDKRRATQKQVERVRKIVHTMEARGAINQTKLRAL